MRSDTRRRRHVLILALIADSYSQFCARRDNIDGPLFPCVLRSAAFDEFSAHLLNLSLYIQNIRCSTNKEQNRNEKSAATHTQIPIRIIAPLCLAKFRAR